MRIPKLRFKEFSGEWEEKKLEEIGIIGRGKSKHRPRDDKRLFGGKYPFIQTGDIRNAGLFLNNYTQTYSDFGLEQSKLWEAGTLCITIAANIAETSILNINACFPDSIIGVNVFNDKANNIFLKMYFDFKRRDIEKISEGLAQSNLNLDKLKSMFFKIPIVKEQQKIADFLSSVDKKISIAEEKLNLFKDYKKGIMQKIFKQKIRFKDSNGNEFPDWELVTTKDISKITIGFTPSTKDDSMWNGKYKWLSIADLKENGKYICKTSKTITDKGIKNKKILKKGTLIMSFKLTLGRLGIISEEMFTNEAICHFNWINKDLINTEYIYYYLSNTDISNFGKQAVKGITLNSESLNSIEIYLPCLEEQKKIANFLSSIDNKIENLSNKLENLKEFKKGLLQKMFV